MTTVLTNPNRRRVALMVIRSRLEIEIENPHFAGKETVRAAKHWLNIPASIHRSRTQLLPLVEKALEEYEK